MTALLEATDTWAHNIDRGKINNVVFLDLKKAFDLVDHEIFLKKTEPLNLYGLSFLEDRTQMCSINGLLYSSCSATSNNIHNIQTSLNEDLKNVHYWLRANKLTLNMTKAEFMLIGPGQRLSTVTDSQHLQLIIFELP